MSLPKLESFTDADGTTLHAHDASWVDARTPSLADLRVFTNRLKSNTAGGYSSMYAWTGDTFGNDQYAQAVYAVADSAGDTYQGPSVRLASAASQGYTIDSANGDRYMEAMASFATLYHDTGALSAGDVQRIEASGTTVTYKVNGTTLTNVTDNTWSTGSAGLLLFGTVSSAGRMDDWEGGNLVVVAKTPYQPWQQRAPILAQ